MTSATSLTLGQKANPLTADICGRSRNKARTNYLVMQKARALFPRKTASHLVEITGYSQRAVEAWLSGEARIPSDALSSLLHSDFGREFLAAVMTDAKPAWWKAALAYFAALDALTLQRAAKRRLREALDADTELTTAIARAEHLMAGDEAFHRPQLDALRAMGGLPDRTGTKAKGGGR